MGFFFSDSQNAYVGKILKQLNSGMSVGDILAGMNWHERAKLLLNLKDILKCQKAFITNMQNMQGTFEKVPKT